MFRKCWPSAFYMSGDILGENNFRLSKKRKFMLFSDFEQNISRIWAKNFGQGR